ncbi:MAG TPA: hypothetical protein VGR54_05535 [Nitrosopumilaceae archaeon]|nr:hypothetical protein [Nitrosopumilaceae archaeon]
MTLKIMLCNCKKCQHVWEQVGFIDKNGVPIDGNYHCPRCGELNGISLKDRMREMYKKMGKEEPVFYD